MDGRLIRRLALCAFCLPGLAKADAVNSEWMSTTRTLSMGNVGIASADDPSAAAFYNPAALARAKKSTVEIFNPQFDVGGGSFSISSSLTDWVKQGSFSKLKPLLLAHPGVPSSAGYSIFPNINAQNFSFGILLSGQGWSYYNKNKDAYFYHSRRLFIPSLGLSIAALGGRFRLGAAVRGVQIYGTDLVERASTASVATTVSSYRNGFAPALDAGVLITMPWPGLPTIGAVARNVGGTSFSMAPILPLGNATTSRHEILKMTYDGGFSLTGKFSQGSQLVFAVDYRDVLDVYKVDMQRRINVGLEYGAGKFFFFRTGFAQGYITGGFGINVPKGSLDIGTYGEELDAKGFHGFLDRRYSLRLTRRF